MLFAGIPAVLICLHRIPTFAGMTKKKPLVRAIRMLTVRFVIQFLPVLVGQPRPESHGLESIIEAGIGKVEDTSGSCHADQRSHPATTASRSL